MITPPWCVPKPFMADILLSKDIWGMIASIITVIAMLPYMASIIQGKTKPHAFTWLIWTISTYVVFFAQFADNGGAGTWSTAVGATFALFVLILSLRYKGDYTARETDWLFLIIALSALPFWLLTDDPLTAVILLVLVDVAAYIPTIQKAWHRPHEEQLQMYVIMSLRNAISVYALTHYSWTTLLFPVVTGFANVPLIGIIMLRRRRIPLATVNETPHFT